MKIFKVSLFSGLMLVSQLLLAAATPAEELTVYLSGLQSMQADFAQKTFDASGKRVLQENKGEMIFKKPDLFRWSVKSPLQQLIVSNGKQLWVYDIDLEQVSKQTIAQGEQHKPAMVLLSNPESLKTNFTVASMKDKSAGDWFELKPKVQDAQFTRMAMYFEKGKLMKLQFEDTAGQFSHIDFSNIKRNMAVSDKTFNFIPPAGVDVVGMDQ